MARVCEFCQKRTETGNSITRRGLAKAKGGVGRRVTGKTKRTFKPNIQTVNALLPDGSIKRLKVSAKAIKMGLVVKPLKRRYAYSRRTMGFQARR